MVTPGWAVVRDYMSIVDCGACTLGLLAQPQLQRLPQTIRKAKLSYSMGSSSGNPAMLLNIWGLGSASATTGTILPSLPGLRSQGRK
eukprot:1148778-Pelagomonas_calceolata.AAC.1